MSTSKLFLCFSLQFIFLVSVFNPVNSQGLKVGFYAETCPNAEAIVKTVMGQVMSVAPSLGGPLLRMHFHDCFVRGCDGSVLLDSPTQQAEKDAIPNQTLRGYQIFDRVKTALEQVCPGVVSCADIVALVARDAVVALEGPSWEVETGRRDGLISNGTETFGNLIGPTANISTLINGFQRKGLSIKDLVVLSGGHTIGTSHCSSLDERLYNFTGNGDIDPRLDSEYMEKLKLKCRQGDQTTLVEMDPGSFKTFDESYFTLVNKRRGLFQSDAALLENNETRDYIISQAGKDQGSFFKDFGVSMVNMGRIEVLTGNAGEIRKVCSKIN
ncbi:hypothetical protein ACOSP7_012954 [Xanthoceras sorbifolium]